MYKQILAQRTFIVLTKVNVLKQFSFKFESNQQMKENKLIFELRIFTNKSCTNT